MQCDSMANKYVDGAPRLNLESNFHTANAQCTINGIQATNEFSLWLLAHADKEATKWHIDKMAL